MPQIKRLTPKTSGPKPMPKPPVTPEYIDPHRTWERAVRALEKDPGARKRMVDEWWWRACCRWYAGDELGVAEALALQDIEDRYERRRAA